MTRAKLPTPATARQKLLLALPALTVLVVGLSWFGAGSERPVRGARLYGGPTVGVPRVTFRLEVVEAFKGLERQLEAGHARVVLRASSGNAAVWSGDLDRDGGAEVSLPSFGDEPLALEIALDGRELGRGRLRVGVERWQGAATRRGGFQGTSQGAPARLRLAPARGAYAVPFSDDLIVKLESSQSPVAGAEVELEAEDGEIAPARLVLDADGIGRAKVTPLDHGLTIDAGVRLSDGSKLSTRVSPPVVPGAFDARIESERLVITAPVPRDRVYYDLVTENFRIGGGSLALAADGHGGARGEAPLPKLPGGPVWAVVSSARDLESPGRVGWPLHLDPKLPALTFDVPDLLLLDTLPQAQERDALRRRRVHWVTAGLCISALILEGLLLLRMAQDSNRKLTGLVAEGLELEAPRTRRRAAWTVAFALAALGLGFLILAGFALLAER